MENTKKFNHTAHKALWNWLADNPGKNKMDYFKENNITENIPKYYCYACGYAYSAFIEDTECSICPLIWGTNIDCCQDVALYHRWYKSNIDGDLTLSSELARKIINLPVKNGVETI